MARPYRCVVAYDGTAYYGWQEQKYEQTVAGTLQATFARVFGKNIKVVGASRTDAGVHAYHQVCRFLVDLDIDPAYMRRVWNASLPLDIHIRYLDYAPEGFHPQHNIESKQYYYHICDQRPLPFGSRYRWWLRYAFDPDLLERALHTCIGTHDFRSFCSGDYTGQSTVCTMYNIDVRHYRRYGVYQIRISGNRFMQHMVRRIVGAACDVARGRTSHDKLYVALHERDPQQHFMTAPGHGLLLRRITYQE